MFEDKPKMCVFCFGFFFLEREYLLCCILCIPNITCFFNGDIKSGGDAFPPKGLKAVFEYSFHLVLT